MALIEQLSGTADKRGDVVDGGLCEVFLLG
jgi:hypothetical protein